MTTRTAYVLIVGGDPGMADELKSVLERDGGVRVTFAADLREAFLETAKYTPDYVVLDLSAKIIPGFKPIQVPKALQANSFFSIAIFQREHPEGSDEPILPVTADALRNQLFRIHDQLNRRRLLESSLERYSDDHITADFVRGQFDVDGRPLDLAPREQELLRFLIQRPGEIVTRAQLHQHVWGYETRSLDVHIRRLRQKLGDAASQIEGVIGFGYRFLPAGKAARHPESIDTP